MSKYIKNIIFPAIIVITLYSNAHAKTFRTDSLGLPGDNFDLYGALELFKNSSSPEDFEKALNSPNNGINNLDLNGDNQTDYIRVIDHSQDNSHSIVMQDVLSQNQLQDVAVIGMEKNNDQVNLQVIGDEALYGKNYIIEPADLSANSQPNNNQAPPVNNNNSNYNNNGYSNNNTGNYNSNMNYNNNGYNNNNANYNNNNTGNYNNTNYNNGNYNGNYNSNNYNSNGYYDNSYNGYNNGYDYNYNNNNYYASPPPPVNVTGWPMIQFIYGPQYTAWVSPWRWNAYPSWWSPWRPVGLSVYYGRVNVYHNNYRPVVVRRVANAHQVYYPHRNYSPAFQNRSNNSPAHYGPRTNMNMQNQGGFHPQNNNNFARPPVRGNGGGSGGGGRRR
jgi:hypothetical protein